MLPERREINSLNELTPSQTWESLFEQGIPDKYKIGSQWRINSRTILDGYANVHVMLDLLHLDKDFHQFPSTDIDTKNTTGIKFTSGTEPYGLMKLAFFSDYHPQGIEIVDRNQMRKLESKLRESRTLNVQGMLAGEVLFTSIDESTNNELSVIGLGVVDKDIGTPLGIIFCPEGMFTYKRKNFTGGNKQRKAVSNAVTQEITPPIAE